MSIDPRLLSQLLQTQLLGTSSWWNSGDTDSGGDDSFGSMLQSLLSGNGLGTDSFGGTSLTGVIPAEYATYPDAALQALFGTGAGSSMSSSLTTGSSSRTNASEALARLNSYGTLAALSGSSAYDPIIAEAARTNGVPEPLIKAVIDQESSFQPYAVSGAGAKGLMQLMDSTASGLGVTDSFDPEQNIKGGTRFLSELLAQYGGDEAVALAAYNAGPGRLQRLGISNRAELTEHFTSLPKETQNYVTSVLGKKALYEA